MSSVKTEPGTRRASSPLGTTTLGGVAKAKFAPKIPAAPREKRASPELIDDSSASSPTNQPIVKTEPGRRDRPAREPRVRPADRVAFIAAPSDGFQGGKREFLAKKDEPTDESKVKVNDDDEENDDDSIHQLNDLTFYRPITAPFKPIKKTRATAAAANSHNNQSNANVNNETINEDLRFKSGALIDKASSDASGSDLLFVQLPSHLPIKPSINQSTNQSNNQKKSSLLHGSDENSLLHLESGEIGKLRRHRSGKVTLLIGESVFDITEGVAVKSDQAAFALTNNNEKEGERVFVPLGKIAHRLIATMSIDQLVAMDQTNKQTIDRSIKHETSTSSVKSER